MLDELGQKIIGELQDDARQSFREIGRKLSVSEGTVRNRVKSLLKSETMKISAIPNPSKLELDFQCIMCVEVKVGTAEYVEQLLIKSPNVIRLLNLVKRFFGNSTQLGVRTTFKGKMIYFFTAFGIYLNNTSHHFLKSYIFLFLCHTINVILAGSINEVRFRLFFLEQFISPLNCY